MKYETETECIDLKSCIEHEWSREFKNCFGKHLHPIILKHSGRCLLEKNGHLQDPYSVITSNQVEFVNMIKSLQHRKEISVELICLNLLMCQKSVYADIQCG